MFFPAPPMVLVDALPPKHLLLLLLDNCEHLLQASADLATALLHACPKLQILATRREPPGVSGQAVQRVPSLGIPAPTVPAEPGPLMEDGAVQLDPRRLA
jgi:predicted ATPase